VKTLRADSSFVLNQQVYAVALTAATQDDDISACLRAGMDFFLQKPLSRAALFNALSSCNSTKSNNTPSLSERALSHRIQSRSLNRPLTSFSPPLTASFDEQKSERNQILIF
jgi:CheY-like chemotaxis protein